MDPTTLTIIAILVAAASELIAVSPLKQNSLVQILLDLLAKTFPKSK
jgi:hypothetical protein